MPTDAGLFASYAGLLCLATSIIYAGAWSSLPKPPKTSTGKLDERPFEDDEDEDDDDDTMERLSASDAYLFPVLGSAVLGGFFLIFKYFGKEWINWLLGWYFSIAGVGSVWKTSIAIARFCVGKDRWTSFDSIKFMILKKQREAFRASIRTPSIILLIPSLVPSILYSTSWLSPKPAILSNILAVSFAHNALAILKLDSFATGCILLSGLFVYDVWWVFGTNVMVSVATGLDVPIKLLWPKSVTFSSEAGYALLGLGDVVIPGAFITLALRYDLSRSSAKDATRPFAKPYFNAAITSYIIGLGTTIVVMHSFKAAQPALLYLSPACILSFLLTAGYRGELKKALEWRDEAAPSKQDAKDYPVSIPNLPESSVVPNSKIPADVNKSGEDFVTVEAMTEGEGEGAVETLDEENAASAVKKRRSKKKKA